MSDKPDGVLYTVMNLDITLANCGVSILDVYGPDDFDIIHIELIETEKSKHKQIRRNSDDLNRSYLVCNRLNELKKEYNFDLVIAEVPGGSQNSRAAFSFGTANGILGFLRVFVPVIEVQPLEVKRFISNKKSVSKVDVINWAFNKFPELRYYQQDDNNIHLTWPNKAPKQKVKKGNLPAPITLTRAHVTAKAEHIADSLAVGMVGMKGDEFTRLMQMSNIRPAQLQITKR